MDSVEMGDGIYGNFEEERNGNMASQIRNKLPSNCGTVCLGVIVALLLAGNIGYLIYHASSPMTAGQIQDNHQRDQLQRSDEAKLNDMSYDLQHLVKQVRKIVKMMVRVRDLQCETGWKNFSGSCYYISTEKKSWTSSREDCIAKGADLVIIDSQEEKDFLSGLASSGANIWIGLTDNVQEGTWMWVDGSRVTTTYWGDGQPNSEGNQDCGEMVKKGEWNDDICYAKNIWICEK
ncbi:CD209 antigen-like protein E [Notolabrus celidotus]|uniref:CD209 antigen-like protein E n=1 Tax=Notolabrus celidotus TaxID=1203425 RepID=UPI00148F6104|nr:CD209 antigen-like protein E [Notolabrus celidotus]